MKAAIIAFAAVVVIMGVCHAIESHIARERRRRIVAKVRKYLAKKRR